MQLLKPKVENPIKFAHPCIYTHTYRYILRRCTQYYTHKPRGQVRFSREPLAARSGERAERTNDVEPARAQKRTLGPAEPLLWVCFITRSYEEHPLATGSGAI